MSSHGKKFISNIWSVLRCPLAQFSISHLQKNAAAQTPHDTFASPPAVGSNQNLIAFLLQSNRARVQMEPNREHLTWIADFGLHPSVIAAFSPAERTAPKSKTHQGPIRRNKNTAYVKAHENQHQQYWDQSLCLWYKRTKLFANPCCTQHEYNSADTLVRLPKHNSPEAPDSFQETWLMLGRFLLRNYSIRSQ